MKSFNEAAKGVAGPSPAAAPPAPTGHGCQAPGCPLAGTISESTRGGGPWFCGEHFFRGTKTEDEVTLGVRNRVARGKIVQAPRHLMPYRGDTPTVATMESKLRRRPDRQPGEDDA